MSELPTPRGDEVGERTPKSPEDHFLELRILNGDTRPFSGSEPTADTWIARWKFIELLSTAFGWRGTLEVLGGWIAGAILHNLVIGIFLL